MWCNTGVTEDGDEVGKILPFGGLMTLTQIFPILPPTEIKTNRVILGKFT